MHCCQLWWKGNGKIPYFHNWCYLIFDFYLWCYKNMFRRVWKHCRTLYNMKTPLQQCSYGWFNCIPLLPGGSKKTPRGHFQNGLWAPEWKCSQDIMFCIKLWAWMYKWNILAGISKVPFEFPHKIYCPYIEICVCHREVSFLDLSACKRFWNGPQQLHYNQTVLCYPRLTSFNKLWKWHGIF